MAEYLQLCSHVVTLPARGLHWWLRGLSACFSSGSFSLTVSYSFLHTQGRLGLSEVYAEHGSMFSTRSGKEWCWSSLSLYQVMTSALG